MLIQNVQVEHMPLWYDWASFVHIHKLVLLSLVVGFFLIFWEIVILISKGAIPVCSHTSNRGVFPLPNMLSSISCHHVFDLSHSESLRWNLRVAMICISLLIKDVENIFLGVFQSFYIHQLRVLCLGLYAIFYWFIWSFDKQFLKFFMYFGDQSSVRCGIGEDLFPLCRLLFSLVDHVLCFTEASLLQKVPFINYFTQCLCYWGYI